jgi:hypothetical protein
MFFGREKVALRVYDGLPARSGGKSCVRDAVSGRRVESTTIAPQGYR